MREHVEFESNGIGDFIIARPDGIPTYNFAVIVDDHLMKINLVIRGEEHLSNTPRQILMYEALGYACAGIRSFGADFESRIVRK